MSSFNRFQRGSSECSIPSIPNGRQSSSASYATDSSNTVTVPKSEYEFLVRRFQEYERLKQALLQGGIAQSSLESLISCPEGAVEIPQSTEDPDTATSRGIKPDPFSEDTTALNGHGDRASSSNSNLSPRQAQDIVRPGRNISGRLDSYDQDEFSVQGDDKLDVSVSGDGRTASPRSRVNDDNRTIILKGIPDRATHSDIAASIRGGALVDIFLRSRERSASISFADSKAAQEFFAHAKRHHLYILDKPVDVSWSDRQFILSNYLTAQLGSGTTRNILIRGVHPNLTEARIREDMEHIHNLVIISVMFSQGNAYISTNSVQKASYARNCMRSRMPYKLMKIEFYPDECAEMYPKIPIIGRKETPRPAKKLNPMANRFEMLLLEDDGSSEDSEDQESRTSISGGINWAMPIRV